MKALSLRTELLIRVAIIVILLLIGVGIQLTSQHMSLAYGLNFLKKSTNEMAGATERWLESSAEQLDILLNDERIASALNPSATNTRILRQAMYEYSYLNNQPNTYLISPLLPNRILSVASAVELPTTTILTIESLRTANTPLWQAIIQVGEKYALLTARAITEGTSKLVRGYVVQANTLPAAFSTLYPPRNKMINSYNALPAVAYREEAIVYNTTSISAQPITQIVALPQLMDATKEPLLNRNALQEEFYTYYHPLPTSKNWFAGYTVLKSTLVHHMLFPLWPMWLLIALATFPLMLWPYKGGWSDWLRQFMNPYHRPENKAFNAQEIDYTQLRHFKVTTEKAKPAKPAKFGEKSEPVVVGRSNTPEQLMFNQIRDSLKNHHTKLLFQPVYDAVTNDIIMHEVYLRILDDKQNIISPAEFLPICARFGFLPQIDSYVLTRVVELYLHEANLGASPLAVNLSGDSFESIAFLETLMTKLSPVMAPKLILELRSQEILRDPKAMNFINECRSFGCQFAIDYFGGGSSMLKASKRMRFEYIKLDAGQFTATAEDKKELIRLTKTANDLRLPLILEKVETPAMIAFAQKINVDYLQGYALAKPDEELKV